jgi:methylated-DNA-[protein]-cysteine S-methyltransferase
MLNIVYFDRMPTPLGGMVLASDGDALIGAWFDGQRHQPPIAPAWQRQPGLPVLRRAAAELAEYFAGERVAFSVPLAPVGTPFQHDVWRAIAGVPYGATIAYRDLAARAGRPESIRAAGTATGRNPLSIIVPCHRIVGADGALTGYAGGLARKRSLLALEHAAIGAAAPRLAPVAAFAHALR